MTKPQFKRGCVVLLVTLASACSKDGGPTTPTGSSLLSTGGLSPSTGTPLPASSGEAFEVTGVVTDDQGGPIAGVEVTMAHSLGGREHRPSVRTDGSGGYTIAFTANPWTSASGRGAARAEVVAEGYDWYWRTVLATSPQLVENFRLHRIKRVTAGDSIVLSVTSDNGDCTGWQYAPCGRLRVAVPAGGNLTMAAIPVQVSAGLPSIEVCCVAGNEVYGNPVTIPVTAGTEIWAEVGQTRGSIPSESVIVNTSLEPQ